MIDERILIGFINSLTTDVDRKKFNETHNVYWKIHRYNNEFKCLYKGNVVGKDIEIEIEYYRGEKEKFILNITDLYNGIVYRVDTFINKNTNELYESLCSLVESLDKYSRYKLQESLIEANLDKIQC